jgi:hypothetical protein
MRPYPTTAGTRDVVSHAPRLGLDSSYKEATLCKRLSVTRKISVRPTVLMVYRTIIERRVIFLFAGLSVRAVTTQNVSVSPPLHKGNVNMQSRRGNVLASPGLMAYNAFADVRLMFAVGHGSQQRTAGHAGSKLPSRPAPRTRWAKRPAALSCAFHL